MSQRKARTSAVALLAAAGGLLAAAPVLITAEVAAAAERTIADPNTRPSAAPVSEPSGTRTLDTG
jgi:hypothetical protein